ncbi:MAG: SDR family NAD(P)-dependent oxidoreductase [Clostridiales bacterium]|nr:SDR family NAD(P)-dependent oxidoreductase [Clostridiales bacterium]
MSYAVVTGASGGMGRRAAAKLAGEGWTVFGLDIREPDDTVPFRFIKTDLTDPVSVDKAYAEISEMCPWIDCVVHMAGIYDLNSLVEMPDGDFVRIFEVNLFSVYRVNRAFMPLIRPGARIIITSSELAPLSPLPFTGIYGITKSAVEKYALSLRMELQLNGIEVIILRPGAVDTGLLDVSTKRLDDFCSGTVYYRFSSERFRRVVDGVEARKISPEKIAETVIKALKAKRPRIIYSVNRNPLLLLLDALPIRLQNLIIRKILL